MASDVVLITNLTISQNGSFSHNMIWSVDEIPQDLSTYTAKAQVRQTALSENFIVELTTENDRIFLGEDGTINLFISDEDTASLEPLDFGVYDLFLIPADGEKIKFAKGAVQIIRSVTRFD